MKISRRTMLRGTGALMALPFLEAMSPFKVLAGGVTSTTALPPLRMGIFSVTGGTVLESWRMKEAGPLTKLPSILRPLEFAKDDLLLVSGLSHTGRSDGLNAHEACAYTHLTGAPEVKKVAGKIQAAMSVDQAAAAITGEQTYLPSIEIGLNANTTYSFRGPDSPVPCEGNPRLVFERMFRGRKPVVPNWSRRSAQAAQQVQKCAKPNSYDKSVLDLVREDAKGIRQNLGQADKHKLDEYLDSVRSVERRVEFIEAKHQQEVLDMADPGPSKLNLPTNLPPEGMPIWQITRPIDRDPERHAEYIALMSDLMILAFQTDTTRVATFSVGSDDAFYPGVVTVGYERHCHTLEHQGNAGKVEDADPIAREACRQIHAWYTTLFAEVVKKMKAIDEGGSSLLDNSMMLYTSYMADGGHGRDDYPILLAGRARGSLNPGRQLVYKSKTPVANLYVEMLDRMGAKAESFGDSKTSEFAGYEGRLPGLG
jgi:hypothetical protein